MTNKPRPQLQPGETRAYPVLPLRDIVVFPHMIVPLFVGREKSIKALEEVMRSDTFILLATQKNASDDYPSTDAIFEVGTLASVLQLLKLPDGTVKVLVEGATRAKVLKYTDRVDYYEADASAIADDVGDLGGNLPYRFPGAAFLRARDMPAVLAMVGGFCWRSRNCVRPLQFDHDQRTCSQANRSASYRRSDRCTRRVRFSFTGCPR